MFLSRAIILCVGLLGVTLSAWSQDAVVQADLKYKKILRDAFYIDQQGFWIVGAQAQTAIGSGRRWNVSIQKFAPDLSKKEWEADIETEEFNHFVYDPKHPSYLYVRTFDDKYRYFGNTSYYRSIFQIDSTGKVINKKLELEDDKILDEELFFFCDASHYYEVWAKKKSNDLVLIKYDHAALTPTRSTLRMPALEKKQETKEVWNYGGKTDSTLTLLQYNEDYKSRKIHVRTIHLASGESSEFYYDPGSDKINISPAAPDRFRDGIGGGWDAKEIILTTNFTQPWTSYGNIVPIEGEAGYYFYTLGSFTNKKAHDPTPEGFILTKLDS